MDISQKDIDTLADKARMRIANISIVLSLIGGLIALFSI
jgi:hypothetical protein